MGHHACVSSVHVHNYSTGACHVGTEYALAFQLLKRWSKKHWMSCLNSKNRGDSCLLYQVMSVKLSVGN